MSGKIELAEIKIKFREVRLPNIEAEGEKRINLILKADVSGSLEALSGIIKTFPNIKIINESVGDITDGDVKLALSTNAIIIGFKSRLIKAAENLAKAQSVKIISSDIIYDLFKNLEVELKNWKRRLSTADWKFWACSEKRRPANYRRSGNGGEVLKIIQRLIFRETKKLSATAK